MFKNHCFQKVSWEENFIKCAPIISLKFKTYYLATDTIQQSNLDPISLKLLYNAWNIYMASLIPLKHRLKHCKVRFVSELSTRIGTVNLVSVNSTKWSNTLKRDHTQCAFDHFIALVVKGLTVPCFAKSSIIGVWYGSKDASGNRLRNTFT